jgi:hypothetical protein
MNWETPEAWLPIPGYAGYEASSLGRIRSVDRLVYYDASYRANAYARIMKGRVLRPAIHAAPQNSSGHLMVMCGRSKRADVHVLVCLAFHGSRPDGMEVLHDNHNPADNRPGNLRWGTRSENLKMDYAHGVKRRWA